MKSMNYDETKSAIQTLSTHEIQACNLARIEDFTFQKSFNQEQLKNIRLLEEILLEITNKNKETLKSMEKVWLESAKKCFQTCEIYNLAYALKLVSQNVFDSMVARMKMKGDVKGKEASYDPYGYGLVNDCNCNIGSIFSCIGGYAGGCKSVKCNRGKGCGFAWAYTCEGKCAP
jgi:hypothetical protein